MRNRVAVGLITCATLWAMATSHAVASDPTDLPLVGGSLVLTAEPTAPNFSSITMDGTAKTGTVTLSTFEVNDARGSGAGWSVTVQATRFAEHNGTIYVIGGKQLPVNSLSMTAPTVAADGTSSAAPSITAGPYTMDSGSATKIASAAVDSGMGKYDFGATTLTVSVPANAYAGRTYRSDLTVTVATGP